MNTKQALRIGISAGLLVAGGAMSAGAVPISGAGERGRFTGEVTYEAASDTSAKLVVKLANTSERAYGGYITSFVLNNPDDRIARISRLGDAGGGGAFALIELGDDSIDAAPHGRFDFGAVTKSGSAVQGIGVNASDTLTFHLIGTGLSKLSAASFLTALSSGGSAGQGYAALDVRFQGFTNGGSDTVAFGVPGGTTPGTETPPGGGTTPGTGTGAPGAGTTPGGTTSVPEPGSISLLGTGVAAIGAAWRRRARA